MNTTATTLAVFMLLGHFGVLTTQPTNESKVEHHENQTIEIQLFLGDTIVNFSKPEYLELALKLTAHSTAEARIQLPIVVVERAVDRPSESVEVRGLPSTKQGWQILLQIIHSRDKGMPWAASRVSSDSVVQLAPGGERFVTSEVSPNRFRLKGNYVTAAVLKDGTIMSVSKTLHIQGVKGE